MERVTFSTLLEVVMSETSSSAIALATRSGAGAAPRFSRPGGAGGRAGGACCFAPVGMMRLPKAAVLSSPSKKFHVTLPESLAAGQAFVPPGRSVALFRDAEGVYAISTDLHAPGLHREEHAPRASSAPATARGSRPNGTVTKGPAPEPLPWRKVTGSGGELRRRRRRRRFRRARR